MFEYKVVVYRESGIASVLSSFLLAGAKVNPVKFTHFLNENGEQGWRVVTMEKDVQRVLLFFKREAYVVVLTRQKKG